MVTTPRVRNSRTAQLLSDMAWVAFAVVAAIASAGLILALDHPQNDSGRPELTARGDAIVGPRLAQMAPALTSLSAAADSLSAAARAAYGGVRQRDTAAARSALPAGDAAVTDVTIAAAAVQQARAGLLDGTSAAAISQANRARGNAIDTALTAAAKVPETWAVIAGAALVPISVIEAFATHDATVLAATSLARESKFADANTTLIGVRDTLATLNALATLAAKQGRDTSTLTGWIRRATDYDEALIGLYGVLAQTGGTMTADAQTALDKVNRAQQALPKDNSVLTIVVSEVGGQTMTAGLVDLDQVHGQISAAAPVPPPAQPSPSAGTGS